jgi:hypothetical protein
VNGFKVSFSSLLILTTFHPRLLALIAQFVCLSADQRIHFVDPQFQAKVWVQ